MTRKIFRAIFLVALAVLLASLMLILGVLYGYFGDAQATHLRGQLTLAAQGVEMGGEAYLESLSDAGNRLTWVAADGEVLYDNRAEADSMENHLERAEIRDALTNGEGTSVRYSTTLTEQTRYFARRLSDGTVLRVSNTRLTILSLLLSMLQPMVMILALALALALILARGLARKIVRPLSRINLDAPGENVSYDELAPVLRRLEHQHKQIRDQMEAMQTARDEFETIIRSMREGLVLLNPKQEIVSINDAAVQLFHADADCVGKPFLTVSRMTEISAALRKALEAGSARIELTQDGRLYQLEANRIDSEGSVAGIVLIAFDVTEKVQAEQMRSEFTANVSHELKTPLQTIMGSAELLENGMVKPEDAAHFASRIRSEATRLLALINDIISLSQMEEQTAATVEGVDLTAIARETVESLQTSAAAHQVQISVEGEEAKLTGVPHLLTEIVYNLCDNAIRYNVEGGKVLVKVQDGADAVTLTVTDTGIGIPAEHRHRIFERFYRVDKSHSRATGGTGLGLSIVKHAVQLHRGRIDVDSRPGAGTTVIVTLPKA